MTSRFIRSLIGSAGMSGMLAAFFAITTLSAPDLAAAQQLEEITVTATRRAETDLQVTPIAVSAVSQAEFDQLFAQDIGEVATYVPGFTAATVTGFNAASFGMRGAAETDIIVYFDPKVGVIVDDFVIPHVQTQLLEPFDIEAIEVLRGPQGTLFGKNTTSGAVVVRTIRPELKSTSFDARLQYGSFNDAKVNLAANLPLGETVAFRFAGLYQQSDGYYENGKVDTPTDVFGTGLVDPEFSNGAPVSGDGDNVGGKDVFSARAKLLFEPSDKLSILGQLEFIQDRSEPLPVVNVTPDAAGQLATLFGFPGVSSGDPLDQAGIHDSSVVGLGGDQKVDVFGAYLNLEYQLENHTVYGLLGHRTQESRLPNEYLGTPYESFFAASRDDDRDTFQFEARIASDLDGNFNYVGGVFYQTNDVEFCVEQQLGLLEFFGSAAPGILDNENPLLLCNRQDATAFAVFADFTFDITDQFSIGVGGRYTDEEKDYIAREGVPAVVLFPNGYNEPLDGQDFSLLPALVQTDGESWQEPTYRVTASYQFNEDFFGYFTYARGFKSGGYNDQAGSGGFNNFPVTSYDPEFADSFEVGIKTDFADGRGRLNATVFTVNYEDFQRSTVVSVPGTAFQETRTFNAAEVDASGLELELWWQFTDALSLRANLGTLDAEYNEFLLDRDNDPATPPDDLSGRDVVRAPELTAGLDLTWVEDLASGADIRVNLNYNYEDENVYYYNDDLGAEFDTILDERNIVNASVTWNSADDQWFASIFGKNLTDDRYKTAAQAVGVLWTFANYGPPRTYGVQVGYRFAD
ncbi:MAG: TonB-dependent receptor [Woeseiaceae bacterium]|nr:TonB-dependent receptor [Woeseiaceae bacterium]